MLFPYNKENDAMDDREFRLVGDMGLLIMAEVAAGHATRKEIVEFAVERHAGDGKESELRALAEELTGSMLYQHYRAQVDWPLVTDCDRLDIAFAQLAEQHIVTRHNFECDHDEEDGLELQPILDEMDQVIASGQRARGYAYYEPYDTAMAVDGGGLCIDFGSGRHDETEADAVRIGKEVADALRQQGLVVDWDGTWHRRITVWLDWKRRRPWSDEE